MERINPLMKQIPSIKCIIHEHSFMLYIDRDNNKLVIDIQTYAANIHFGVDLRLAVKNRP